MQTYYDVLDVPIGGSQDDVRRAYRRLLTRVHPDRSYHDNDSVAFNPARDLDAARVKLLNKAYDVLANPHARRRYDDYLAQHLWGAGAGVPARRLSVVSLSGHGGGVAGVVEAVMRTMSDVSTSRPTHATVYAAAAAAAGGGAPAVAKGSHLARSSQQANPMTRALGTCIGGGGGATPAAAAPPSSPPPPSSIVHAAALAVPQPHGEGASVRPARSAPQSAAPAVPAAEEEVSLPHRVRVVLQHLVIRA
ncbi:DnaJ domain containing protein [Novymonas esmeraldas]|uniref:DnaJ domain containing protein n=1 Tax=Novymonas esmeraldas TaxID=1808958 RepID=A0AAW0F5M3_9TRYP